MGFKIVVDDSREQVGVLTDVDLRRPLDRDLDIKQMRIQEVMTKHFALAKKFSWQ